MTKYVLKVKKEFYQAKQKRKVGETLSFSSKEEDIIKELVKDGFGELIEETKEIPYHEEEKTKTESFFITNEKGKTKFSPALLGDFILKNTPIKTLKGKGHKEMYHYKKGVYVKHGEEQIVEQCSLYLQDYYRQSYGTETIGFIQAKTFVDPQGVNQEWLNFENCLLNPLTMKTKKHTPDLFSITQIPIVYDPKAKCPQWQKLLKERTKNEEELLTLQEFFGYCFLEGQPYEMALLLVGPKRTCKSTVLNALELILGKENVTGYPIQEIGTSENKYAVGYMYGKLGNIMADLDARALKEIGPFMTYTGGDLKQAETKFGHSFAFHPTAKLVFSCNSTPVIYNKEDAFYRRWLPLTFTKQTPENEVDPDIKNKTIPSEASGILNWALEGLKRLQENKKFSLSYTDEEKKDFYEKHSDSPSSFILQNINNEDDEGTLIKRSVYKKYLAYCKENNLKAKNPVWFGRDFINTTGCGSTKIEGIPAYKGVSFKDKTQKNLGDKY